MNSFADLITARRCEGFFVQLRDAYKQHKLIVLLYGADEYSRKLATEVRRAFKEGQRLEQALPKMEDIQTKVMELGMKHNIRITLLMKSDQIHEWALCFTREVASGPAMLAKRMRGGDIGVSCNIKSKSGKDETDTYWKMLQNLFHITPVTANAILANYPTLKHLRDACLAIETEAEAKRRLADVSVSSPALDSISSFRI
jgi:hypothetical protein